MSLPNDEELQQLIETVAENLRQDEEYAEENRKGIGSRRARRIRQLIVQIANAMFGGISSDVVDYVLSIFLH